MFYPISFSPYSPRRFQSGWFFRHTLLDQFDYYWRVEPSVQFYCDLDYDVFQFMHDNKLKYGTLILISYLWRVSFSFYVVNKVYIIFTGPIRFYPIDSARLDSLFA